MRDPEKSREIHERAIACAHNFKNAEHALLASLVEVEADRTYELHDCTYLTTYAVKVLGLTETTAEAMVRVIRKAHHVPELCESVLKGEVTLFKAKAIASVITSENKDEWIDRARTLSKSNLEREVSRAQGVDKKRMTLDFSFDAYDRLVRARDLASTKLAVFASFEDAIDEALEEYLYKHDPLEKAERSRGHSAEHEVVKRDHEQCQFIYPDGTQCSERKWLHIHHIIPRSLGGPDTLENLVTLCSGHHRMIHRRH